MPTEVVVAYGRPEKFWFAALIAHLLSIAWLALDIRSGHEVLRSDWRGVFGLLAFVLVGFLDLTVLGNLYFLMGGGM